MSRLFCLAGCACLKEVGSIVFSHFDRFEEAAFSCGFRLFQ